MNSINLDKLVTESINPDTSNIDAVSTIEMLRMINEEDKKVALAVEGELPYIGQAVDAIAEAFKTGGRLIYTGAGTSGRLGILDASECPPTFGVDESLVVGLIAGGQEAIFRAKEGAEDNRELCVEDLKSINFNKNDILVGIAASGRTPYVIGGLEYANNINAVTVSVTCNPDSEISRIARIPISPVVGPEAVSGSTRMKAGTAQKMVLNMLTTGAMIKYGKVYKNLMVDVKATNEKLVERAKRLVMQATGASRQEAEDVLALSNYSVKISILMILSGLDKSQAVKLLAEHDGYIKNALRTINKNI